MNPIQIYGLCILVGWIGGVVFMLAFWWRPITRAHDQRREIRRLRMALEDERYYTGLQTSGPAQRMAEMIVEEAGKGRRQ